MKREDVINENRRSSWTLVLFALIALIWFNVAEVWTRGITRVGSMVIVVAFYVWLIWRWKLQAHELGLETKRLKSGLKLGGLVLLVVAFILTLAYAIRPESFIDSRYHVSWGKALVIMFLAVPLRTVLFEEFIFRSVLLAGLMRVVRARYAAVISSLAFGLWHIGPSLSLSSSSEALQHTGHATFFAVSISVLSTAAAGLVFCWLRFRSGSLVAPVLAHWSINAFSVTLVVAAYAQHH